jgi:putative endopeptidase
LTYRNSIAKFIRATIFFGHVNGKWLESTEIPADKSRYGTFDMLRDAARDDVRAIIEAAAAGEFAAGSDEQRIGDLYASYMDMETRNARGVEPLAPEFAAIDAIASYDDLAAYFGAAVRRGYSMPLGGYQYPDFKDPNVYALYLSQSGLGLPDREYYLKDDERSEEIRAAYLEHIATMFALADLEGGDSAAQQIMALETAMAEQNMRKEDQRDRNKTYNKYETAALAELMPQFAWDRYLPATGMPDPGYYVVRTVDYFKALDGIIRENSLDTWKLYLKWAVLNDASSRLNEALDKQNFAFYGTVLSGTEQQEALWKRATRLVSRSLGEAVGKVYVAEHFPPEAKARMVMLVDNLIGAYRESIQNLDWMSEETKVEALDKLSKFRPKIGYPDKWRDYSDVEIVADDLFANLASVQEHNVQRRAKRQGGPVDRDEWGMSPQTVNAYYSPALNEIVFPAAILQPPFFNLEADDAVNYGAIGAVIGHEIGHGFDDSGSQTDGDGVLRNWWTESDKAQFEARTNALVAQYDDFYPFEDLHVNGEFTLGENIGDLGGVSIGLLAYQRSLNGEPGPVIDGLTAVQRVFYGYAQVWRSKYREQALRRQIATDPHSPAKYRTNGPVRNVDAFYEAFDVTPENAMYLAPEARVKIW